MYQGVRGRAAFADLDAPPETSVSLDREACSEMGARLEARWQRVQQEQARFTAELRTFDLMHAHAADGSLTTASWLRGHCHMTHAQARQQVTVSRQLESLPETAAAYADGEISYQHTAVIASCARKLGVEEVAPRESILVDFAKQTDPFRLGLLTQHLEHVVDPDGSLGFFEQQHDRRRLEFGRTSDGMYTLRGLFDAEGGAVIATGLESLMGPPAADDRRPGWQRRADALVEVFQNGAPPAQLTVLTELGTLRGLAGSPGGELRDGLMIPAATVRRIACDCDKQEGHLEADGIEVRLGDRTRVIAPKLRRQLELRDRGCRFPGCDRPSGWCDGHHLLPWEDGGPTVLANLVLLCRRHHRLVHEGGWRLVIEDGGELLALPP